MELPGIRDDWPSTADMSSLGRHTPAHLDWVEGDFWREVPGYRSVDRPTFLDARWQAKASVRTLDALAAVVGHRLEPRILDDLRRGLARAPMALRVSPYIVARIDWNRALHDPLRRQFIPAASDFDELGSHTDHPCLRFDSLGENADSPTPGLIHRYPDRVLFLALDTCPVYCRFCTRSYAVGNDTQLVEKISLKSSTTRWQHMLDYIRDTPSVEDAVISGGDVYNLRAEQIRDLGHALLDIPHLRRMRFATKGLAVCPMKILSDEAWVDALTSVVERGRKMHKSVVVHTHFNHPHEITDISERALDRLFERGIVVRNQSVLQRGVNDDAETMGTLVKRLGHLNVQPYYVYAHDMVKGVEPLRTTLQTALDLERAIRGRTAGFHSPTFVVDAPGGGGKRDAHSFAHYDRETGISVFRSPNVDPNAWYCYFDPIHLLSAAGRRRWQADPEGHRLIAEAISSAHRSEAEHSSRV